MKKYIARCEPPRFDTGQAQFKYYQNLCEIFTILNQRWKGATDTTLRPEAISPLELRWLLPAN